MTTSRGTPPDDRSPVEHQPPDVLGFQRPVTPRGRVRLTLASVIAAGGVIAVLVLAAAPGAVQPRNEQFAGPLMPPGMHAPHFALVDQTARPATLGQYRGRVVVLAFMYSHCTTACPLMATEIRGALDDLPGAGRAVPVLAISVDPAHDSQASARRFIAREQMAGRMRFLLGPRHQLARIWKGYSIQPLAHRQEHSAFVFLIDRRGLLRVGYPTSQLVPEDLAHDLRLLLNEHIGSSDSTR